MVYGALFLTNNASGYSTHVYHQSLTELSSDRFDAINIDSDVRRVESG